MPFTPWWSWRTVPICSSVPLCVALWPPRTAILKLPTRCPRTFLIFPIICLSHPTHRFSLLSSALQLPGLLAHSSPVNQFTSLIPCQFLPGTCLLSVYLHACQSACLDLPITINSWTAPVCLFCLHLGPIPRCPSHGDSPWGFCLYYCYSTIHSILVMLI